MKRIQSFSVNHDLIGVGMYLSRVDGDVKTYDVRMVVPNCGVYPSTGSMHTIEHLFATYARNSQWSDQVVYVGPMGCRTGFYILVRDTHSRGGPGGMRQLPGSRPGGGQARCAAAVGGFAGLSGGTAEVPHLSPKRGRGHFAVGGEPWNYLIVLLWAVGLRA